MFDGRIGHGLANSLVDEALPMLTDLALKKLKLKDKSYKIADRNGMYAFVTYTGQVTFRYDYRVCRQMVLMVKFIVPMLVICDQSLCRIRG